MVNGLVDTYVHTMEQYATTLAPAPLQDRQAEAILSTLVEDAGKILADPPGYEARATFMWCATQALNTLIGCGVDQDWATHMIGHEITAMFGLDHAQTLAIVLPNMLDLRREAKREKLLQYAARVWNIHSGSADERIDTAIARTLDFFESLGVKTRLGDYQIGAEAVPRIVAQLEAHGMTALGERRNMDLALSRDVEESFRIFQGRILEQYLAMSTEFNFIVIDANQRVEAQQGVVRQVVSQRVDLARFKRLHPLPLPPAQVRTRILDLEDEPVE